MNICKCPRVTTLTQFIRAAGSLKVVKVVLNDKWCGDFRKLLVSSVQDGTVENGTVQDGTVEDGTVQDGNVQNGDVQIVGHLLDTGLFVEHKDILVDAQSGSFFINTSVLQCENETVARFLLSRGEKVHLLPCDEDTLLLRILKYTKLNDFSIMEIVKVLLESGVSVNERGMHSRIPVLVAASRKESVGMLQILLDHGADITEQNTKGDTALIQAVRGRCPMNVSFLLKLHKEKNLSLDVQNHMGRTAVTWAVLFNYAKILKQLIDYGADVNIKGENGTTPLMYAVTRKLYKIMTTLVRAGCDVNCQDKFGFSPLMWAAKNCCKDAIIILLNSGAHVNAVSEKNRTQTALTYLSELYGNKDFKSCFQALLKKGARLSYLKPILLHTMITSGQIDVISELIRSGLEPVDVLSRHVFYDNGCCCEIPTVSPLCVALLVGNVSLARIFYENLFMTYSDATTLIGNKMLRRDLKRRQLQDCLHFLDELSTQPLSLYQLAFKTVSSAVGIFPERENNVNMLPLPQVIKDKLLFKLHASTQYVNYLQQDQQMSMCELLDSEETPYYLSLYFDDITFSMFPRF